jgi:UDP-glucose 4-epimerase
MDRKATAFSQNDYLRSNIPFKNSVYIFDDNCTMIDHTPERDFIYVNYVANAMIAALLKLDYAHKHYIYNISSGRTHYLKNIIEIARNILHKNMNVTLQNIELEKSNA